MILRIDKLAIELPMPAHPSPNSASAVQELLGGKFGEMSTLMNYTFQSFNFRGRDGSRALQRGRRSRPWWTGQTGAHLLHFSEQAIKH